MLYAVKIKNEWHICKKDTAAAFSLEDKGFGEVVWANAFGEYLVGIIGEEERFVLLEGEPEEPEPSHDGFSLWSKPMIDHLKGMSELSLSTYHRLKRSDDDLLEKIVNEGLWNYLIEREGIRIQSETYLNLAKTLEEAGKP